jgi:histidine ammonia-lyase
MPETLDGSSLTLDGVERVAAQDVRAVLDRSALERMAASRASVERMAAGDAAVYGVNTGVGLLSDVRIAPGEIEQLQRNVIRSHACGVGPALGDRFVRAMMLIRANVLALGYSGIRPVIAERLCDLLNRRVTPVVPSRGSVGASGDLAPLSHVALVLIGEGEASHDGRVLPSAAALMAAGIEPVTLAAKEAVSLINGTQAMLGIGALCLVETERLAAAADVICAITLDALKGTPTAFDARIHDARPHRGQRTVAGRLRRLLDGSQIRASHVTCGHVQDAYSLRCAPQVHGAVRDALEEARRVFTIELNSATDNPLVFGDEILSGGNFHGQVLALQLDFLAIALASLGGISERRIDRLVNPAFNEGLPPFLAGHAGLESGLMMAQVTAAALVAENRVLANPASPGSLPTDGNKEDFVSMGMTSALKFEQVLANTRTILAIEALAAATALRYREPLKSSPPLERARRAIEEAAQAGAGDRVFAPEIERLSSWLRQPNNVLTALIQE